MALAPFVLIANINKKMNFAIVPREIVDLLRSDLRDFLSCFGHEILKSFRHVASWNK